MCNSYRLHVPVNPLAAPFEAAGRPLTYPEGAPNIRPGDYRISDPAPIIVLDRSGAPCLTTTRWAWRGPGGRPVFNVRSEGRSFAGATRCLVPSDGFHEFTEPRTQGRKTRWLFTLKGAPWFWIAGIVRDEAFALLTTAPGPDVEPYHDRQIVVLPPDLGLAWLDLSAAQDQLLRPNPAGALEITRLWPPQS